MDLRTHGRRRTAAAAAGFTLVELLTVIGIIILLIGILLPVLSAIRKAAWATDSQAAITNLASAMERYRQDFNAYPGPLANGPTPTHTEFQTADGRNAERGGMTMTENGLLGLLGGWEPFANPPTTSNYANNNGSPVTPNQVGNGPMTHNPLATARKRYSPYVDANFGVNVQRFTTTTVAAPWAQTAMTAAENVYDSKDRPDIPEFIDKFPDSMPILYLRAKVGAPSFVAGSGPSPGSGQYTVNATTQYNPAHLLPYIKDQDANNFPGRSEDINNNGVLDGGEDTNANTRLDFDFSTADDGVARNAGKYFRNPGVTSEVRQKDGFWLIGAGPDRKFGTKDDQTNFGSLQ